MSAAVRFLLSLAVTAALVALVWFGGPLVFGERPPGGLLGLIGGIGLATALADLFRSRRKPPPSGPAEPSAAPGRRGL